MAAGKINLQANDGAVVGLVVPDGLGSGERQIALGVNLSGITAYHLLQGNLSATINANYVETSATTTRNYTTSDYIFDSLNNKLYDCILASTSGALLTNTTYFTLITAGALQLNTALIPFANGIDSNGSKNTIVYKNETITGLTLTAGKNYVYAKNDGTYGVKTHEPVYNKVITPCLGDLFVVNANKWIGRDYVYDNINIATVFANSVTITSNTTDYNSIFDINNVYKVITTGSTARIFKLDATIVTAGTYYLEAYYKPSTNCSNFVSMSFALFGGTDDTLVGFDLALRISNKSGCTITYVGDGWYKLRTKCNIDSSDLVGTIEIRPSTLGLTNQNTINGATCYFSDWSVYSEDNTARNYLDAIVHADANGQVAYVEELPKVEYKDIVKANEFKGKNACTAWVVFDDTTVIPTIKATSGIATVIRTSARVWDIYPEEAFDDLNFSIVGGSYLNTGAGYHTDVVELIPRRSKDKVTMVGYNSNNTGVTEITSPYVSVHIMGGRN